MGTHSLSQLVCQGGLEEKSKCLGKQFSVGQVSNMVQLWLVTPREWNGTEHSRTEWNGTGQDRAGQQSRAEQSRIEYVFSDLCDWGCFAFPHSVLPTCLFSLESFLQDCYSFALLRCVCFFSHLHFFLFLFFFFFPFCFFLICGQTKKDAPLPRSPRNKAVLLVNVVMYQNNQSLRTDWKQTITRTHIKWFAW